MPVFGIVPYRTEARTRSEARIQAEVDRLLEVLRTVANVIRTALSTDRQLLDLFPNMIHPSLRPRLESYTFDYPTLRLLKRAHSRHYYWDPTDNNWVPDWRASSQIIRGLNDDGSPLLSWGTLQ